MSSCRDLTNYLASERRRIYQAIAENKWYLSERAGHDVGYRVAQLDFIERFLPSFAHAFRTEYCARCSKGRQCGAHREGDT